MSENVTVLCICVSSVGVCKVVSFVFLSIRSATVTKPLCVRGGGGALSCARLPHFKGLLLRCLKKKKFFMSFCFCVIVNPPSCLESSRLCNYNCKLFWNIFFGNASCKRLVLAVVGFVVGSVETRFKKLSQIHVHAHTCNVCRQGLCVAKILHDDNSTFLS